MGRVILDPKLISKIAACRKKPEKYIKELVSKFARKHGMPAEVALVVLAKQNNLGTAFFQRKLDAAMQAQIRGFHVSITSPVSRLSERPSSKKKLGGARSPINKKAALKQTIQGLILILSSSKDVKTC